MDNLIQAALNNVWPQIAQPQEFSTPDDSVGRLFTIVSADQSSVNIETEGGSPLIIQRVAFLAALRYLAAHQHNQANPCEIRSNQIAAESGPLCRVTRDVNSGTRVINYIAPILAATGLVNVRHSRPNAVWLA